MRADKTLLQMKYARIIALIAKRAGIDSEKAMDMFYNSKTYMFMSQGISDFHCLSDNYLAEEVLLEQVKVTERVESSQKSSEKSSQKSSEKSTVKADDVMVNDRVNVTVNAPEGPGFLGE